MTELRDARLRQALDQAPDAGLRPPARVRDAVRVAAREAVQPAWRRWWPAAGERRTPWLAALASVLVASLVVVLWQGQEIPGARKEPQLADQQAPPAAPAPAAVPAPAATPTPAQQTRPAPVAAAPATRAPTAKPVPPPPARAAAAAADARMPDNSEQHATARAEQAPPAAASAAGAEAAPAEALAKAAPPPAPAMAAPAPAPLPAAAARFAAPPPPPWTQVRISAGGRTLIVPRSQAEALPALVTRLLAAPREPAAPVTASLSLELDAQGVLEWSEEGGWRLLPQGDPQRAQWLRADEATAAALRVEAERLLGK